MKFSMKPGSWLEIKKYNHEKIQLLFSAKHIECLIINETEVDFNTPEFPFLVLIHNIEQIQISKWKTSKYFQGFLLRTETINGNLEMCSTYTVWLDLVIKNRKAGLNAIKKLNEWPFKGYFLSPSDQFPLRYLNQIIKNIFPINPRPFDLSDSDYDNWPELENFDPPVLEINSANNLKLSIIIPHFESPHFLCNVLKHLQWAFNFSPIFEVLVVDDCSSQKHFDEISYFIYRKIQTLPLRIFRWNDCPQITGGKKLFRAGASRNWGATFAKTDHLFFLDSDMLTPSNIAIEVLSNLEKYDVIQFVRQHIPIQLSSETTDYDKLVDSPQLFTEEAAYWNTFFESNSWSNLPDFWKYTCTYALALKKETFFKVGRIRRNFIRYGFEDTDLGYRLFKQNNRFELVATPLLHLTGHPDQSQSLIYRIEKQIRIKPMAKVFYKLNLDPHVFERFQSFLD